MHLLIFQTVEHWYYHETIKEDDWLAEAVSTVVRLILTYYTSSYISDCWALLLPWNYQERWLVSCSCVHLQWHQVLSVLLSFTISWQLTWWWPSFSGDFRCGRSGSQADNVGIRWKLIDNFLQFSINTCFWVLIRMTSALICCGNSLESLHGGDSKE